MGAVTPLKDFTHFIFLFNYPASVMLHLNCSELQYTVKTLQDFELHFLHRGYLESPNMKYFNIKRKILMYWVITCFLM